MRMRGADYCASLANPCGASSMTTGVQACAVLLVVGVLAEFVGTVLLGFPDLLPGATRLSGWLRRPLSSTSLSTDLRHASPAAPRRRFAG
jgi:hypothetical protein